MKNYLVALLCCGIVLSANANANAAGTERLPISTTELDALIQKSLHTFDVPGIAVAIVKDDELVYARGFGVRSLNSRLPVNEHTLFGIASNSKAFTAAALAMLVDEKKIRWDDKVTDYIPEFKMSNPYVTDEFTIRDLLTHRSGLGLGSGDLMLWPEGSDFTRTEIIHNLRYLKPVSSFRSKFDYDNNLYIIAGEVVARVSGLSWEAFIEQRIFAPLGMKESTASRQRVPAQANVVDPHVDFNGKVQVLDVSIGEVADPAGGINSNLLDMSQWVKMQLHNGSYGPAYTQHLFSPEAQKEMWTPQTLIPMGKNNPYNSHFSAYGLGWFLSDEHGYLQATHTGGLTGIVTQVTLIPELHLGIIVLTNQQVGAAFSAITDTIKDRYFGMPKVDRIDEYQRRLHDRVEQADTKTAAVWDTVAKNQGKPTVLQATQLAGTYRDPWFGEVVLSDVQGVLQFKSMRSPRLIGELYFYKGSTYAVKWHDRGMLADALINFTLDAEGNPSGMTMSAISPLTDFSFDFQDLDLKRVN